MPPFRVPRVYGLADADALGLDALEPAVATMAEAGLEWIQVRAKHASGARLHALLEGCCRRLEGSSARLWINDRADLAALFPVFGVHVGQTDLPPSAVRRVVGEGVRIGLSTHGREQLRAAAADPAVDVIAVGPIFDTRSKECPDPTVGLELLRWARGETDRPLVAIGGIEPGNLTSVLGAGADSVAVLGALCRGDVARNARRLLRVAAEEVR